MDIVRAIAFTPRRQSLTEPYDRRTFLRHLAAVGLAAPAVSVVGCNLEEIQRENEEARVSTPAAARPVLLPWAENDVRIAAPLAASPVAYVSRVLRRAFIDSDSRIEIELMLAAHISVSSGLWRIPLPGDDLGIPIDAGDELREFEETPIGEWNPTLDPTEGDFRLRRGRRKTVAVAFDCVPMAAREGLFSAGPWEIAQCAETGPGLCREDFMEIGTGSRYSRRDIGTCTEPVGGVRYVTWACPDR
jgi:hypothetical protein